MVDEIQNTIFLGRESENDRLRPKLVGFLSFLAQAYNEALSYHQNKGSSSTEVTALLGRCLANGKVCFANKQSLV